MQEKEKSLESVEWRVEWLERETACDGAEFND